MWKTAVVAFVSLAAGAAAAVSVAERWRRAVDTSVPGWTRLPNGLQFCVQRVRDAKDVAVVTVFGIGSDGDPAGKIGLAHFAEHLYVTAAAGAAPARTADEWADHYDKQCSATTQETVTCMAGVVGSKRLERELADVAARMSELRIESTDLDRERPRVLEQIDEADERAAGPIPARRLARARLLELPNEGHAGGIPADVDRFTLDDVRAFARRFYCPANARIAVAGDVDPAAVAEQIERLFAALPGGEPAPQPPRVAPRFRNERIDRGEPPGPGYEACRAVCIAYPIDRGEQALAAAPHALGFWHMGSTKYTDMFVVMTDECSITAMWEGDERPIENVIAAYDNFVEDFALHATGPAAADEIRETRRKMRKTAEEFRKLGIPCPWDEEAMSRPLVAAIRLAVPGAAMNDWDTAIAAIQPLTNEDLRRFVASWHVAERRVVVDVRGWRRSSVPDPDADTRPGEPAPSRLPELSLVCEVRVALIWDEATQTLHRKLGEAEYAKDDDLQKAVAAAHDDWVKKGKPNAPVTIDSDPRVPWDEVMTVVNIVKRCGIEKIEFAMGAPPKKAAPK